MVRLAPSGASPEEVRFSRGELGALVAAADACGHCFLSTFIREVGLQAAWGGTLDRPEGWDDYQIIKAAAEECNLPLAHWLRLVVLAAIGHTPLPRHMARGAEYLGRGSNGS
ncbi:MAG: hypothetical protein KAT70_08065 [Thermoplasmata archaeon]|nr:hypothetical protein [Thermoplasmata archaeon]